MIGDSAVGKTSLVKQYFNLEFENNYKSTIGVDCKTKTLKIGNAVIKMQIFDTAGQEKFKSIIASYYKGAHAIIYVYDVTNTESYNNIDKWHDQVKQCVTTSVKQLLIGNKIDLQDQREISKEEGIMNAKRLNMHFIETSAKENSNVDEAFSRIGEQCFEQYMSQMQLQEKDQSNEAQLLYRNSEKVKLLQISSQNQEIKQQIKKKTCC